MALSGDAQQAGTYLLTDVKALQDVTLKALGADPAELSEAVARVAIKAWSRWNKARRWLTRPTPP